MEQFIEVIKEEYDIVSSRKNNICLDCGCILVPSGGCYFCPSCGNSKCS